MLDLWFEEDMVSFASCHRDFGGKMVSPTTGLHPPLCWGEAVGSHGNREGREARWS